MKIIMMRQRACFSSLNMTYNAAIQTGVCNIDHKGTWKDKEHKCTRTHTHSRNFPCFMKAEKGKGEEDTEEGHVLHKRSAECQGTINNDSLLLNLVLGVKVYL